MADGVEEKAAAPPAPPVSAPNKPSSSPSSPFPVPAPASSKKRSRSPHREGGSSDSGGGGGPPNAATTTVAGAAAAAAQASAAASAIAAAAAAAEKVGLAGMRSVLTAALASSSKAGGDPSAALLAGGGVVGGAGGGGGFGGLGGAGPSVGAAAAAAGAPSGGTAADAAASLAAAGFMPPAHQVEAAARKCVAECPPFVHLSSRDCAPQLRVEDGPAGRRLTVRGGMRGYRMARATHGVAPGTGAYYYEALVLEPPSARELVAELPPNVRLGRELRRTVQDRLVEEEMELRRKRRERDEAAAAGESGALPSSAGRKKKKAAGGSGAAFGSGSQDRQKLLAGHVRIGWSMRTGDLQAPVGYDRWSYGLRDIAGSRVHDSRREDRWGGEPFGPGDVVGFAISLVRDEGGGSGGGAGAGAGGADGSSSTAAAAAGPPPGGTGSGDRGRQPSRTSHIRFFKNGQPMGHFVVSRGVRQGGEAFDRILPGTYYPAVSVYMGGAVRINFGPHFVHPPRSLPSGMKVRPVSELCTPPPMPDEAVEMALKERAFPKKTEEVALKAFKDAVKAEATIRRECYENHARRHVAEVRAEREARGLSTGDLPERVEMGAGEENSSVNVTAAKGGLFTSSGVEL